MAKKYDLTESLLEALIQLDDEYFSKKRFREVTLSMSWDKNRFDSLIEDGWIEQWRERKGKKAALFKPTGKAHRLVRRIYKILVGKEDLPMSKKRNPYEKEDQNLGYAERLMKKAIRLMDEERKQNKYE